MMPAYKIDYDNRSVFTQTRDALSSTSTSALHHVGDSVARARRRQAGMQQRQQRQENARVHYPTSASALSQRQTIAPSDGASRIFAT
jgi:hypothetical protein